MPEFTVYKGSSSGTITTSQTTRSIPPTSVLVKITHSGLCGTDVHFKTSDMALGHEGAGVVESVGPSVTLFKPGDRVGWGYQHDSCGHCKQCLSGNETFCSSRAMYGSADLDQGSIGEKAVWKEDFLFRIPDGMKSEEAAPLMCGGATVFNALYLNGVKSTDVVGVIGVGGLGHLAIQFARKMGCEVVVFSGTDSKKEEAVRLGATEFYAVKGVKDLGSVVKRKIDHLLVTTSQPPDWKLYLPIMAPRGSIYPLTVSDGNLEIPSQTVIESGLKIVGSLVAARQVHREMLEFANRHGIKPMINTFPMTKEGVEQGFEALTSGKMRYRGVLVA